MCNTISLLAVTNRHLSVHPYPEQIARICQTHPKGLILREKDLEAESYLALAAQVLDICHKYDVPCILHTFWKEAIALGCTSIHLPLPLLRRPPKKGFCLLRSLLPSRFLVLPSIPWQKPGKQNIWVLPISLQDTFM